MSHTTHHCIVVTHDYDRKELEVARKVAMSVFPDGMVTEIILSPTNGAYTFFIGPDGSLEERSESDEGDKQRSKFLAWLNKQEFEDHSSPFKWAEVSYGDSRVKRAQITHYRTH